MDRKDIVTLYTRVCHDSGFRLDFAEAAKITAKVIGINPLEIWIAVGDMKTMQEIADGSHPTCNSNVTK